MIKLTLTNDQIYAIILYINKRVHEDHMRNYNYKNKWKKLLMKDMSVLQEAPFTDRGSIVEVFTDISIWLGIRSVIETINANAA